MPLSLDVVIEKLNAANAPCSFAEYCLLGKAQGASLCYSKKRSEKLFDASFWEGVLAQYPEAMRGRLPEFPVWRQAQWFVSQFAREDESVRLPYGAHGLSVENAAAFRTTMAFGSNAAVALLFLDHGKEDEASYREEMKELLYQFAVLEFEGLRCRFKCREILERGSAELAALVQEIGAEWHPLGSVHTMAKTKAAVDALMRGQSPAKSDLPLRSPLEQCVPTNPRMVRYAQGRSVSPSLSYELRSSILAELEQNVLRRNTAERFRWLWHFPAPKGKEESERRGLLAPDDKAGWLLAASLLVDWLWEGNPSYETLGKIERIAYELEYETYAADAAQSHELAKVRRCLESAYLRLIDAWCKAEGYGRDVWAERDYIENNSQEVAEEYLKPLFAAVLYSCVYGPEGLKAAGLDASHREAGVVTSLAASVRIEGSAPEMPGDINVSLLISQGEPSSCFGPDVLFQGLFPLKEGESCYIGRSPSVVLADLTGAERDAARIVPVAESDAAISRCAVVFRKENGCVFCENRSTFQHRVRRSSCQGEQGSLRAGGMVQAGEVISIEGKECCIHVAVVGQPCALGESALSRRREQRQEAPGAEAPERKRFGFPAACYGSGVNSIRLKELRRVLQELEKNLADFDGKFSREGLDEAIVEGFNRLEDSVAERLRIPSSHACHARNLPAWKTEVDKMAVLKNEFYKKCFGAACEVERFEPKELDDYKLDLGKFE